jgi:hypothetical protein
MRRRTVAAIVLVAVPAAAALACSSLLGFKDLTLLDAGGDAAQDRVPPDDGGDDGDAAPDAPAEGGCAHAVPPGPPSTDDTPDGGDGGGVDLVMAMDSLDFGSKPSMTGQQFDPNDPLGFDLDGVCTCIDDGGPSCTSKMVTCDTAGGRDESANVLLAQLGNADGHLSQANLVADLRSGQFGMLVHVQGYNGLANDQAVTVDFFPSPGTTRDMSGNPIPPNFDGQDQWLVTNASVLAGSKPNYTSFYEDNHAYVNNHVLVTQLTMGFPLLIRPDTGGNDNPITFVLSTFTATARLVQGDAGGWTLQEGTVGARWPTTAALYAFHVLADLDGGGLCGSNISYQFLQGQICSSPDIAADPGNDNKGTACNALSMGLGFTASPALFGDEFTPTIVPTDCPDGWAPMCQ